jgi:hypothetical protein
MVAVTYGVTRVPAAKPVAKPVVKAAERAHHAPQKLFCPIHGRPRGGAPPGRSS